MSAEEIVRWYAGGFFPLYDEEERFYWERLPVRAVLRLDAGMVAKARALGRRGRGKFEIRYTTAVGEVIGRLKDERVKERTWVREEVVLIYETLHAAGLLQTVEAWQGGKLVGGLVGIVLPGVMVAETMFGVVPEASKACLCALVEGCFGQGFKMIDVQTRHDRGEFGERVTGRTAHPCVRLGEECVVLGAYMREFRRVWGEAFSGGVEAWVKVAGELKGMAMGEKGSGAGVSLWREGVMFLRNSLPPAFVAE